MTAATVILGVAAIVLVAAGLVTMVRMAKGPGALDRVIAADVMVAVVVAGLALEEAANGHTTTLTIMVVLSLLGFVGTLSLARVLGDRSAEVWERSDDPAGEDL